MTNPDDAKDKFCEELDALISVVNPYDKLIILGDFNARVGKDHQTWEGTIGKHGTGKCKSNDLLLLKTCAMHELVIINTLIITNTWPVDLIAWRRLAVCSRNVAIYIKRDYIVRQTKKT